MLVTFMPVCRTYQAALYEAEAGADREFLNTITRGEKHTKKRVLSTSVQIAKLCFPMKTAKVESVTDVAERSFKRNAGFGI